MTKSDYEMDFDNDELNAEYWLETRLETGPTQHIQMPNF